MLEIPCPFCAGAHRGDFLDEIDADILECRDRMPPDCRGTLESTNWQQIEATPPTIYRAQPDGPVEPSAPTPPCDWAQYVGR